MALIKDVDVESGRFFIVLFGCQNHRPWRYFTDYCVLHGLPLLPSTALSKQGLAMSLVNEFVDLVLCESLIFVI